VSGRVEQAIEVLQAGLEAAEEDTPVIGQIMLQLARAETVQGHSSKALERELEARRIFEQADDVRGLAATMRLLGDTYRTRGELDEAAVALRAGLELAERIGSVEEIGNCLGNLALVELGRGRFADAVACNLRAIEEFERIGHGAGRAQTYANLAWTFLHAGENHKALEYADRAIEAARAIGHELAVADATDTIARVALGDGQFTEAVSRAEEAAEHYVAAGAGPQATASLELAAEASDQAGEAERARALRERARSLSPS
jgi:tetratricopeptide (TPR) repeat protein